MEKKNVEKIRHNKVDYCECVPRPKITEESGVYLEFVQVWCGKRRKPYQNNLSGKVA